MSRYLVALYTSAWIEIYLSQDLALKPSVALYTSAWIEIGSILDTYGGEYRRTLHECVD